ncbi:hypothetical protein BDP27DRAFT_1432668 [Rhodocollybia butyracea]|uniref:Uncharacterized protein n=1 Tax=Rhodocollybia butyracea TaxID=206335 RepID=A0A9P5P7Y1_9AGAR|nr:hypothetical protein BDP27DRAFT_1432668 [Rhodocollybia butyracea]
MASSILAVCALPMNELTHSGRIVRREKLPVAIVTFIDGKTGEPLKTVPTGTVALRLSFKTALRTAWNHIGLVHVVFRNSFDESEEMAFYKMGGTLFPECTNDNPCFGWIVFTPNLKVTPRFGRKVYTAISRGPVSRKTFRLEWGTPEVGRKSKEEIQEWEDHQRHFDSYFMVPADEPSTQAADQHRPTSTDERPPSAGGHKPPPDGQRAPSPGRHSSPSADGQKPASAGRHSLLLLVDMGLPRVDTGPQLDQSILALVGDPLLRPPSAGRQSPPPPDRHRSPSAGGHEPSV